MKINSPFGPCPSIRCRCRTSEGREVVCMTADAIEVEIPDDTREALVEAVLGGRSDAPAVSSRMWTPEKGFMDVESFIGMKQVEAEQLRLEAEKEKERKRKEKEARERAKPKPEPEPEPVVKRENAPEGPDKK